MPRSRFPLLASALVLAASCQDLPPLEPEPPSAMCTTPAAAESRFEGSLPLEPLFAAAAEEFGVPAALLAAIAYTETRWQMVESQPEFPGRPPVFGLMGLKGEQLERGAELAGLPRDEARAEPGANIRAAAALLRAYADELGIVGSDLAAWAPAVERYAAIPVGAGSAAYVHEEVYGVLQRGIPRQARGGLSAALPSHEVTLPAASRSTAAAPAATVDYPLATWRASPNFNARPGGDIGRTAMVIIHTCEGSYTGCWSWLINPDSRVSAHYVIDEEGARIMQLVREADRGWHIGSSYDCALNAGFECWRNGHSNNHFTIGIEHAGFASQTSWPASQIDSSARLVCDITRRHGITRDNLRILGHAQLQPHNRSDPGAGWPWQAYYAAIEAHCGGADGELVVDSNNQRNATSRGYVSVSDNWIATSATPGFIGTGYYFATTGDVDDPALFHFFQPAAGTRTIDAWWTAGTNRSPAATFRAVDPHGRTLETVRVDQRTQGSRWNTLGAWHFPAGWNTVQLSRQGAPGCVVIADAVRVR